MIGLFNTSKIKRGKFLMTNMVSILDVYSFIRQQLYMAPMQIVRYFILPVLYGIVSCNEFTFTETHFSCFR